MRGDLEIISPWVSQASTVLDMGCGDGLLLAHLQSEKGVKGYGLEIDEDRITECIVNGVNVVEHDLDERGLSGFSDNQFDTVIMTQALQAVRRPDELLDEMLRVGKQGIVTFPNFGYWRCRQYLLLNGKMPMSKSLPHTWYNTPNIHLCTFKDFEILCRQKGIRVLNRLEVNAEFEENSFAKLWPNLLAEFAVYRIEKK
ncbi:methionine biosynthesis protein MetW [Oleiphilus sp. HI0009]|nr:MULTISPECIES: methionine biosynthesis protein MetW [unclassified Oleiphilus]KZX74211.1 methionine biosynthesis protein MetW [Oleiphilus sp. HI0009]KZX85186.1 methionine biosynthesis protein MetW [Oleiphilus sp. HI0009]KZY65902.1 methionine biosynthesis protein MetW [Oleiphilus sp. HI0066]KZY70890.1 methionine biosynthesis protein MetW [Oleiphilus sp. HI0067]KZZ57276.1 methionine biosynthesis protein MetW [Oleiphilus sp. HI0125]